MINPFLTLRAIADADLSSVDFIACLVVAAVVAMAANVSALLAWRERHCARPGPRRSNRASQATGDCRPRLRMSQTMRRPAVDQASRSDRAGERDLFVVETKQVQQRRVIVVMVHDIRGRLVADLVGLAVARPPLTPPPASHMLKPYVLWSRPMFFSFSITGSRPISPPNAPRSSPTDPSL